MTRLWYHRVIKRPMGQPDMSQDYDIKKKTDTTWNHIANKIMDRNQELYAEQSTS